MFTNKLIDRLLRPLLRRKKNSLNHYGPLVNYNGLQLRWYLKKEMNPALEYAFFPQYVEHEGNMQPREFEVVSPEFPKDLKITWQQSGVGYEVKKGDPICKVSEDHYTSFLYSPCDGIMVEKYVNNNDIVNNIVICMVKEIYLMYKKKRIELRAPLMKKVGIIEFSKGVGELVRQGEVIARIFMEDMSIFILSPEDGFITARYASIHRSLLSNQRICELAILTEGSKSQLFKETPNETTYLEKGGQSNVYSFYLGDHKRLTPPVDDNASEEEKISISFNQKTIKMGESLELIGEMVRLHSLESKILLDCIYVKAVTKVIKYFPDLCIPRTRRKWHNPHRIDISIGVYSSKEYMSQSFPTIIEANGKSLRELYNIITNFSKKHASGEINETNADPDTLTINNFWGYDVYSCSGVTKSAMFVLALNDIIKSPMYVHCWTGERKVQIHPKITASFFYDKNYLRQTRSVGFFMEAFKQVLEDPVRLI